MQAYYSECITKSAYIEQEAKKYGFEYIEMDKELFGDITKELSICTR
jgi:hypothetical protein